MGTNELIQKIEGRMSRMLGNKIYSLYDYNLFKDIVHHLNCMRDENGINADAVVSMIGQIEEYEAKHETV